MYVIIMYFIIDQIQGQDLLPVEHCIFFSKLMPFEILEVGNKIV